MDDELRRRRWMTPSLLVLVLLQQSTTFADDPEFVEDDDAALEEALAAAKRLENAEQDVMSDIEVRTSPPPHPTRATPARYTHADRQFVRMPLTLCGTAACAHDLLGSDGGLVRVRADRLALQPRQHHAAVRVGCTRV